MRIPLHRSLSPLRSHRFGPFRSLAGEETSFPRSFSDKPSSASISARSAEMRKPQTVWWPFLKKNKQNTSPPYIDPPCHRRAMNLWFWRAVSQIIFAPTYSHMVTRLLFVGKYYDAENATMSNYHNQHFIKL